LGRLLWLLVGAGTIVLFGAAMQQKSHKVCEGVKVEILGVEEHLFIDENDVLDIVNSNASITNKPISDIDLRATETALETTPWVKNAELFFDNKQVLQIIITERQPIARLFTMQGSSFYIDSVGLRLPLSDKLSARVPMFTNFPSDKATMAKPDSLLLQSVVAMGKYIMADSFWMAQTAQIAISPQATFEIIPTIGNQIIVFGTAEDIDKKFKRLLVFYKNAWLQNGINTYEKLDVQYNNQIVAVKTGTAKVLVDSAKAREILLQTMQGAVAMVVDSADKLNSPLVAIQTRQPEKPIATLKPKKNLADNKLNDNKSKTNPLSIVKKPIAVKPKAIMTPK
jgi:cell division protein FtsQ